MKVVCFGPGPDFKGGISNYNTSLALSLEKAGAEVHIVSWTEQYPSIIPRDFKDKSSHRHFLENSAIKVSYLTNYNNPLSWIKTVRYIKSLKPDMVIFQWAIAIQGLPLGFMAKQLMKSKGIEVVFDCHLVVQKEGSKLDRIFSKIGLKHAHTYIAHAYKTVEELKSLFPNKDFRVNESGKRKKGESGNVIKLFHPIYDLYSPMPDFDVETAKKEMGLKKHVFLFFGFIRKYKGLHQAIEAFNLLCKQRDDVSLLIVGESFWQTLDSSKWSTRIKKLLFGWAKKIFLKASDDEQNYRPLELITHYGLEKNTVVVNSFIPNEDVHKYFQVSDAIILYYLTATPSGVESLSYNFELPVLASHVGHFPETIKDGFNGYLANDRDIEDMAAKMNLMIEQPIPKENIRKSTEKLSWENYAKAVLNVSN
jgi:glycosyltransferase involved in cell wall biosynthesis